MAKEREPFVLDFPDGQRVEDILKKAEANYSKAEIDAKMATKATMSDVERETKNLQNQINEIVRAPESGGDVAAEVYQARVGADGTNYSTLKARLDAETEKAFQFRGELSDLNYTAISDATEIGCYSSRTPTTATLPDKPAGITGPFSLIVNKWSEGAGLGLGTVQVLITADGNLYQRFISWGGTVVVDWASATQDAYQFRGELGSLGFTAISEATEMGFYSSLTSTTAALTDKPSGLEGPFNLIVNRWFNGGAQPIQLLIAADGAVYQRFILGNGTVIVDWASMKTTITENSDNIAHLRDYIITSREVNMNLTSGKFWDVSGDVAELKSIDYWYASAVISVTAGEEYTIYADQGPSHKTRVWTLCDDEMNIIERAPDTYDDRMITESFTVPPTATKLVISHKSHTPDVPKLTRLVSRIDEIESKVDSDLYNQQQIIATFVAEGMTTDGKATARDNRTRTGPAGSNVDVLVVQAASGYKFRAAYYLNDAPINTAIFSHFSAWYEGDGTRIPLETGYFIRLLCGYSDDSLVTGVSDFEENILIYRIANRIEELEDKVYLPEGLRLSLLGDSISSYAGTIPAGNDAYYTGSNSGVSSAEQMWWAVLCAKTGIQPLVINGWSGSAITQLTDSAHVNKVPMSDLSRDQALHSGTTNPDIILIAGGVNDYSYAQQSSQTPGSWDGTTTPVKGNSFTETYACMIKEIQVAYPEAIVICLSTWFTMRGTDNGYTLVNGMGFTQSDYDADIEKVANIMRVPFINAEKCGFNRANFYPAYAQDSSTIPTHPNARGQKIMGEYLADVLPNIIRSFSKNKLTAD